MSETENKELTFEELTGNTTTEEWSDTTTDNEYSKISATAHRLLHQDRLVESLEADLKAAKELARTIREQELPEAMQSANLMEIKLTDGSKISIDQFYKGNISEKNRANAHKWLVNNGHGGIIKHEITVKFGKDEDEKASNTVERLKQQGLSPEVKQGVHSQTLNAFVKEQLTGGKDIPADLFGIYVGSRAKIK